MRSKVVLLAVAVVLVSSGVLFFCNRQSEEIMEETTFNRVLVVDGKEYTVTLTRKGPWLTGTLPPQVEAKYRIKTFRCGEEVQQFLVPIRVDRLRQQGKLWVDENASPSAPGVEGSVFYEPNYDTKVSLIAVVEFDPSIPGIPPVYT